MIREGGFTRKSKAVNEIPSASLADMAFLLLIFFMVSTTFRKEQRREVVIPEAEATQKLDAPRKDVLHLYVERDGAIFINDQKIPPERVSDVVAPLYEETDRKLVTVLRGDRDVPYRFIDAVQKELQEASAVRVTFYTNLEQRIKRERR
ncbi:MAG: biopolymer transporter ExbD [Gemmatimonadetes bacterium]|nr:biopolymer transporter ExbD [Gemmatimonadota bacterium]